MISSGDRSTPRILVVKLDSFGDLFHALPAVHNLKAETGAQITWVTQDEYTGLVRCFADANRVVGFPRRRLAAGFGAFLRELRDTRYDLVVDFQGLLKSAWIARLAKAPRRIGPSFQREGSRWLYTEVVGPRNKDRHAVEENLDVIRHLRLKILPPEFPVRFPVRPAAAARPRVAIFPRSRWPSKNWPEERFAQTAAALAGQAGASVFLFGGAADADACARMRSVAGGGAVSLAGQCSLVETGSWLQEMDLVISNDSGPIHMAAALGRPVLALFGPTDPRRTGPYGCEHTVLSGGERCEPCFASDCPRAPAPVCMDRIAVDRVVSEALRMLRKGRADASNSSLF